MTGRAAIAAFVLLTSLAARQASAQSDDERARMLYVEGDRHYNEGRYELAVEAFQESYRLSGRALLLFNLANAYERLGRYADALEALRGYQPTAPAHEQAQIGARMTNLEQRANELGQVAGGGSSTVDDGLLIPGVVVGGAGLALALTGIVFGVLALDAHSEAQAGCVMIVDGALCEETARDAVERESTFALLADIGVSVGVAAITAGVVLAILGATSGTTETATAVPYAAPRAGGGEVGALVVF